MKVFGNVMGCIAASLLSIVLVVLLIVFPVYNAATSLVKPATITEVIQNVDYTEFLPSSEELKEAVGAEWLETEVVEEVLQSEAVGQMIELYMDDVVGTLLQDGEDRKFTADALRDIVENELDAVIEIIEPYIPEDVDLTTEELAAQISELVDENAEELVENLPLPEVSEDPAEDPLATIRPLLDPTITVAFLVALFVIAGLIYACRCRRFGGMLWLGIDATVAALPLALLAVIVGSPFMIELIADMADPSVITIVQPIVDILSGKLTVAAVICFAIGAVLIVGYILLRRLLAKKRAAAASLPAEALAD